MDLVNLNFLPKCFRAEFVWLVWFFSVSLWFCYLHLLWLNSLDVMHSTNYCTLLCFIHINMCYWPPSLDILKFCGHWSSGQERCHYKQPYSVYRLLISVLTRLWLTFKKLRPSDPNYYFAYVTGDINIFLGLVRTVHIHVHIQISYTAITELFTSSEIQAFLCLCLIQPSMYTLYCALF